MGSFILFSTNAMEFLTSFLLFFIAAFLFYISTRRPKNFPEGLARIPIIGQGWKGTKPSLHLWRTHKLMGHFIGNTPAVTVQDFQLAKDLFNREEWCGRTIGIINRYFRSDTGVSKGIIASDGQRWQDTRRFALKHLRDFGFGKEGLEGIIQEEADEIVNFLSTKTNKDYKMDTQFGVPVINILWTIVAGKRFRSEDPQVQRMMILLNRLFKSKFALEYLFWWYGLIRYYVPGLDTRRKIITELRSIFRTSIKEHQNTLDPNHPRDLIDTFLLKMNQESNTHFDMETLELTCLDLFKAGAETSSTTILWIILFLVRYQDAQERCYQEVIRVTGEERPGLKHNLPYCQAVIFEVQRLSCVAPQTIPHRVTKEVNVEDKTIPRNSYAMANLWGFMKDPDVWHEAEMFRPERFLQETESGHKLIRHEQFVPYGIGRRICMGETLAKDTLFIFMATLVKNLKFENPDFNPKPEPENYTDGFTIIPHPYFVKMKRR